MDAMLEACQAEVCQGGAPRGAIQAPEERRQTLAQVLRGTHAHCHREDAAKQARSSRRSSRHPMAAVEVGATTSFSACGISESAGSIHEFPFCLFLTLIPVLCCWQVRLAGSGNSQREDSATCETVWAGQGSALFRWGAGLAGRMQSFKLKNKFMFAMGANNSPAEFESRGQEGRWQGLDEFVPPQLHNKHDHGENPMLRRYAYAYLWRYHIPNGTNLLDAFGGIL